MKDLTKANLLQLQLVEGIARPEVDPRIRMVYSYKSPVKHSQTSFDGCIVLYPIPFFTHISGDHCLMRGGKTLMSGAFSLGW